MDYTNPRGGVPALPIFGSSFLFMSTPFVAKRPNLTRYNSWDGACFSEWASPTPRGCTAPSLPNFGGFLFIFVHVPSVASAKNDVRGNMWGGACILGPAMSPTSRAKQSRLNVFWGPGPAELMGPLHLPFPSFPSLPSPFLSPPLPSPTLSSPPLRSRPLKSS